MPKDLSPQYPIIPAKEKIVIPDMEMAEVRGGWAFGATEQIRAGNILDRNLRVVLPGGNIQKAIDELDSLGGGIVFLRAGTHLPTGNINLKSNIILEGEAIHNTFIDFNNQAFGVRIEGTVRDDAGNISIDVDVDATAVIGSVTTFTNASVGDFIFLVNDWWEIASITDDTNLTLVDAFTHTITGESETISTLIERVEIKNLTIKSSQFSTASGPSGYSDDEAGLYVFMARRIKIENVKSTDIDNTHVDGDGNGLMVQFATESSFVGIEASYNNGLGIRVGDVAAVFFEKCRLIKNINDGMELSGTPGYENEVSGCLFDTNGGNGLYIGDASSNIKITNNSFNTGVGLRLQGDYCAVSGNFFQDSEILLVGSNNTIIGNVLRGLSDIDGSSGFDNTIFGNITERERADGFEQILRHFKNTSGGSLNLGHVVILKAVAAGNEVTTTTTQGHDSVFGMVLETIADAAFGKILTGGKTTGLKVDGTTDIAIGDFLGTFTTAGIAMKAAAGDMAFAIALEAYATNDSLGVIDALLVTPRKI